jgi:methyltransferase (TIGR00027 family)
MRTDDDTWDITSSVGITALGVAAGRAAESARPDRLIHDPFAEHFLKAAGPHPMLSTENSPELSDFMALMNTYVSLRTKFFDDYFVEATKQNVPQAVILASGLDTRPYRIDMPARTFEIDQPAVLEFKDRVLSEANGTARGEHSALGVDLRRDWRSALVTAGFDAERPAAWLAEGLLPYLPRAAQEDLFTVIDSLSPTGSTVCAEYYERNPSTLMDNPKMKESADELGFSVDQLMYDEDPLDLPEWLHHNGWTVTETSVADYANTQGIRFVDAVADTGMFSTYLTATKH